MKYCQPVLIWEIINEKRKKIFLHNYITNDY
jgi:hypothetical protein